MPAKPAMQTTVPQKLNKKEKKKEKKEKKEKREQEQEREQEREREQEQSGSGSLSKQARELLVAMFRGVVWQSAAFDRDMEWLIRAGLATRETGPDGEDLYGITEKGLELAEVYEEIAMK